MQLRLFILMLAVPLAVAWAEDPAPAPPRALLVTPSATEQYYRSLELEGSSEAEIALWRQWLSEAGIRVSSGTEQDLLDTRSIDLIILPGALALSPLQTDSLYRFLENGGGILATGATGVRNISGEWQGYSLLESWLGAAPLPATVPTGEAASLLLRFGLPGTTTIPPGYHLRLTPYSEPLYLPSDHRAKTGGYWADDGYKDENPLETKQDAGFVTRELPMGGRIAWFGTTLEGLHTDDMNMREARAFFTELLSWLAGDPVSGVEPWPEGRDVGVLVHGDIEDQFEKVQDAVDLFTRLNIPTTYNLLVDEAAKHVDIVSAMLASRGELAIHGDNHDLFAGQEFGVQHQRLSKGIEFIQKHSSYPAGFRPPELAYDSTTVEVLLNLGFEYVSADNNPDRCYPRFRPNDRSYLQAGGITFFPKSELDDYDFFGRYEIQTAPEMTRMMMADFDRIESLHGLYKLNYHSQYVSNPELLGAMESVIRYARDHQAWFATAREISRWVWQREMLQLEQRYDEGLIYLELSNPSELSVRDVVLRVLPPEGGKVAEMAPKSTSRRSTYDVHDGAFFLYLPALQAGEVYTATLIGSSRAGISAAKKRKLIWTIAGLGVIALAVIGWATWYFLVAKKRDVHARGDEADDEQEDDDIPSLPPPNVRPPAQAVRNPQPARGGPPQPARGGARQQHPSGAGQAARPGGPPRRPQQRGPAPSSLQQAPPQQRQAQQRRQQESQQPLFTTTSVGGAASGGGEAHNRDQASPGLFYGRDPRKPGGPPDPRTGGDLSLRSTTSGPQQSPQPRRERPPTRPQAPPQRSPQGEPGRPSPTGNPRQGQPPRHPKPPQDSPKSDDPDWI